MGVVPSSGLEEWGLRFVQPKNTNNKPHHDASFRDDLLVESHGIEYNDRPYKDQMHFYIIIWGVV